MEANQVVVSLGTYEGSLIGFSANSPQEVVAEDGNLAQEFAFAASQQSLSCMASEGNVLAVAGSEEIIKIFNNEVGNKGWCTARASYLGAIHSQFNTRGIDYSRIGDEKSISFSQKVKLERIKLIKNEN